MSKPVEQVVEEVEQLAKKGIQEIVVTGIHLSSYGVDDRKAGSFLELQGKPLLELSLGLTCSYDGSCAVSSCAYE